jgi:multicomponent Na+:H+ antiporter subunit D
MERLGGTGDLKRLGGLYDSAPLLAVLFLIPALSLAGLPPLSGFFAKLSLIQAGLEVDSYWIVGVALAVSLLTLYSMNKIWTLAFWQPTPTTEAMPEPDRHTQVGTAEEAATAPEMSVVDAPGLRLREGVNPDPPHHEERVEAVTGTPRSVPLWGLWLGPIIALAMITLLIGLGAGVSFPLALRAGAELMDPAGYIAAVYGSSQ